MFSDCINRWRSRKLRSCSCVHKYLIWKRCERIWTMFVRRMQLYRSSNGRFDLGWRLHCFFFQRYEAVNSQRQRDKQRLIDLERNFNEEKQQKQRLELQMKTEKTLTKKLQDDLTKFSLAPPRFVSNVGCTLRSRLHSRWFIGVNVQNNVWSVNVIKRMNQEKWESYSTTKMNASKPSITKLR